MSHSHKPSAPPAPAGYQNQNHWSNPPPPPPPPHQGQPWPPPPAEIQGHMVSHGSTPGPCPGPAPPRPPHSGYGYFPPPPPAPYGSPYSSAPPPPPPPHMMFPPGTDPEIVNSFFMADVDRSGSIDDLELQSALSSARHQFSIRTVHLLMFLFANNTRRIGPREFAALWGCIKEWRNIFERFDRDRSGRMDTQELREALMSLGYVVSTPILQAIVSRYEKTGQPGGIEYDEFIGCGIIVKGLTDSFKEKDTRYTGSATLTYETFMLMVLPFIVA